jgi:VRR-NUC domain
VRRGHGRRPTPADTLGASGAEQPSLFPRRPQCALVASPEDARRLVAEQARREAEGVGRRPPGPEERLLREVLKIVRELGGLAYHPRAARTEDGWVVPVQGDGKGWPDVVILLGPSMFALELKSDTGRLTPEQRRWLAAFERIPGCVAMVVRPRDLARLRALLTEAAPPVRRGASRVTFHT